MGRVCLQTYDTNFRYNTREGCPGTLERAKAWVFAAL